MELFISPEIKEKLLRKHGVTTEMVLEAVANRKRALLIDSREQHRTNPPTCYFFSTTDDGRILKVVLVANLATGEVWLKTAYTPSDPAAQQNYEKIARLLP